MVNIMQLIKRESRMMAKAGVDCRERDIPGFNIGGSEGDWLSRQAESFTEGDPNDKWAYVSLVHNPLSRRYA